MYNVLCFLEIIGEKMNTDLLLVLKESVYGNIRQYWEQCSLKMQNEICCSAEKNALGPYLYRFLHDILPGEYKIQIELTDQNGDCAGNCSMTLEVLDENWTEFLKECENLLYKNKLIPSSLL